MFQFWQKKSSTSEPQTDVVPYKKPIKTESFLEEEYKRLGSWKAVWEEHMAEDRYKDSTWGGMARCLIGLGDEAAASIPKKND